MLMQPDYPLRQRDFLLQITRAITAQLELSEVLRRVVQASVVMLAARVGLLALRTPEQQFGIRAFTGFSRDRLSEINGYLSDLVEVVESGAEYDAINEVLRTMAHKIDENLQQAIALPLVFADEPLGLLVVFRSYETPVSPADFQVLQSFADQAAIAVNNAQLYEKMNQERQRLAAILEHSGDGVMILNPDLSIIRVNRAFEWITGWHQTDVIGLSLTDVITWAKRDGRDLVESLHEGWPNQDDATLYVEGDLIRHDGVVSGVGITYAALFSDSGTMQTIIANLRDVTHFRKAQQMQNIFISTVSHELRTPVALIKGYTSTLRRDDVEWSKEVIGESLRVVEEEADRLTGLIDDLLTASKFQAQNQLKLTLSDAVDLAEIAREVAARFQSQTSNHLIELSFPDDFPSLTCDRTRIRQVLDNFMTNAIKYSPSGGVITLGGRFNLYNLTIFVRDEGVGLSEKDQAKVFDRFFRVDDDLSRKTQGTGLGLYLSKAIIEAHHGTIHVKSQPDHGATFYFTIPLDPEQRLENN
ncbi:ATP-binding protein [Anaerolineales bacterium]